MAVSGGSKRRSLGVPLTQASLPDASSIRLRSVALAARLGELPWHGASLAVAHEDDLDHATALLLG